MLNKELLDELKIILLEDYGLELTDDEVAKLSRNVVGYFSLLAKIQHRKNQDEQV